MTGKKLTPEQWCQVYGMEIRDPDGWRGTGAPPWDSPIDLPEFWSRLGQSTARQDRPDAIARIRADLAYAAQRQPAPCPNSLPHIADLVVADVKARKAAGLAEYGTPLQPRNGRRALRDLYEEILDAAQYCAQEIWERDHRDVEWGVHYPGLIDQYDPYPVDWFGNDEDEARLTAAQSGEASAQVVIRRVDPWEAAPAASETAGVPEDRPGGVSPPERPSVPGDGCCLHAASAHYPSTGCIRCTCMAGREVSAP